MKITRWNPRHDMMRLRNEFDRLFEETMGSTSWRWVEPLGGPALDIAEQDDVFVIKASLPGMKPEELDISIRDNILTIKGELKEEKTISEEQYHLRERRYGAFSRTVSLPATVDVEAVEATYSDGVLTLTAPKTEDVKRKRIAVKTGDSTELLESEVAQD